MNSDKEILFVKSQSCLWGNQRSQMRAGQAPLWGNGDMRHLRRWLHHSLAAFWSQILLIFYLIWGTVDF